MYSRCNIRKDSKAPGGKKSPGVKKSKERSHPSPETKKSPDTSEHSTVQETKKERKKESRFEYVQGPDHKWVKVEKDRSKIGRGSASKKKIPSPSSKVAATDPSPPRAENGQIAESPDKLKIESLIKNLHDKKKETMAAALEELEKDMTSKYLPDSLDAWTLTICSALAGIMEDKDASRATRAARVSALLCIQLGGLKKNELDRAYTEYMRPILLETLIDESSASSLKAMCAEAVGMFEFIAVTESEITKETMDVLFQLALNPKKSEEALPVADTVRCAALRSWSLILTGVSSVSTTDELIKRFSQLQSLLESSNAELRVASGKAMVLLCELVKERGSSLTPTRALCEKFSNLSQDVKVEAKYEQQQTFRDILKTYQEKGGTSLRFERKINTEVLYIESWVKKIQYDAFCRVLYRGMDKHLQNNELIRSSFNLSSPLLYPQSEKPNSNEKRPQNGIVTEVKGT